MGRPPLTLEQKEEIRNKLLTCAKNAFITEGFQSVSIRKIAKAAKCNPMTVYKHFDSKQALLRCLWTEFFDELFELCSIEASYENSHRAKAVAFVRAYAGYWWKNQDRYRLVFMIEDRLTSDIDRYYIDTDFITARLADLTNHIQLAINANEIEAEDAEMQMQLLMTAISGILHSHITISEYPWLPFDGSLDAMIDALLPENTR